MGEANAELHAAVSHTKGERVRHTTTRSWSIPYCNVCLSHKFQFETAGRAALPLVVLGILAWIGVSAVTGSQVVGVFVGLPICLLSIRPYKKALAKARAVLKQGCTSETAAVRYVDWYGNFHTFDFTNREYLNAFVAANRRKTMSDIREV